jgi:protein-S-isoprenylcysteine O-methyltransferase Ste14
MPNPELGLNTILTALRTLVYMTVFLALWAWVALRVRVFDRSLGIALPAGIRILGPMLMAAGAIVGLSCVAAFVARGRGTPAPFDAPRTFVATGPYKYVRNPMYIGGLTLLAGFAFYERSPSILFLSLVLFVIVHLLVFLYEEPQLRSRFGVNYAEYCRTVPRWIPKLRL